MLHLKRCVSPLASHLLQHSMYYRSQRSVQNNLQHANLWAYQICLKNLSMQATGTRHWTPLRHDFFSQNFGSYLKDLRANRDAKNIIPKGTQLFEGNIKKHKQNCSQNEKWNLMRCVESDSENLKIFGGQQVLTKPYGVDLPYAWDTLYGAFFTLSSIFMRILTDTIHTTFHLLSIHEFMGDSKEVNFW